MAGTGIQVGVAHVLVVPQLQSGFGSNLNGQLGSVGQSAGLNLGRKIMAGVAAVGVGAAIAKVFSTGFSKISDYQTGLAKLNAGLKSTGNAAGISAAGMEKLATSIQGYSGQTSDSIVAAEQLLLTFSKVKNSAGAGNDVFTRTTVVLADMAARLGGDASANAIKLGKALQDPAKYSASLARMGVVLTAQQLTQIKAFQKSGDTLSAQKVLLGQLEKTYGGTAKAVGDTMPGQIAKAKRAFEEMSKSIVSALLPAINFLMPKVTDAIAWLGPKLEAGIKIGSKAIGNIAGAVVRFITGPSMAPILKAAGDAAHAFGTFVTIDVLPALQNLWNFISPVLLPVLKDVGRVVGVVILGAFRTFGGYLKDILGPVIRDTTGFLDKHRVALTAVAIFVGVTFLPMLISMAAAWVWTTVCSVAAGVAYLAVNTVLRTVAIGQWLLNAAMNANPFVLVATLIVALGVALWYAWTHSETFRTIVKQVFYDVMVVVGAFGVFFLGVAKVAIEGFKWMGDAALNMVIALLGAASHLPFVGGQFKGLQTDVKNFKTSFDGDMNGAVGTMDSAAAGINRAIDSINPNKKITITAEGLFTAQGLNPSSVGVFKAAGGEVHGPGTGTSDSIPAWLSDGEFVVKSKATAAHLPLLHAINAGHYADGGLAMGPFTAQIPVYANDMTNILAGAMAKAWASYARQAIAEAASAAAVAAVGASSGPPSGALQATAMAMLNARGWGSQWPAFNNVVNAESGWNVHATNASSGAYGIPQSLPADKMASAGPDWRDNGVTQLAWMMSYIAGAYGSPNAAWAHEQSAHWYGDGGLAKGWSVVGDRGAELINAGSGSRVLSNADSNRLLPGRPGLFAGATVTIGSNVDLEGYDRRRDFYDRHDRL